MDIVDELLLIAAMLRETNAARKIEMRDALGKIGIVRRDIPRPINRRTGSDLYDPINWNTRAKRIKSANEVRANSRGVLNTVQDKAINSLASRAPSDIKWKRQQRKDGSRRNARPGSRVDYWA